jgi:hypothetical protein
MGAEEAERRPYEASPLVIPQGRRHDDDAVVRVGDGQLALFDLTDLPTSAADVLGRSAP